MADEARESLFPRLYSTNFLDNMRKSSEVCFVPLSDFNLLLSAYGAAKRFIEVHAADPDITAEMVEAYSDFNAAKDAVDAAMREGRKL